MLPRPHTANSVPVPSRLTPLRPNFPSPSDNQTSPEHYLTSLNPKLPSLGLHLNLVEPPKNGPVRYPLPETRPLDDSVPQPIERVETVDKSGFPWGGQSSVPLAPKSARPGRPGTADPLTRFETLNPDPDPIPAQKDHRSNHHLSIESPNPRPANISSMAIMSAPDLTTSSMNIQTNLGQVTSLSPRPVRRDPTRLPPPSAPPGRALPPIPATPPNRVPVVRSADGKIVSPDSPLYEEFAKQAEIRRRKEEALSEVLRRPAVQAVSMPIPIVRGELLGTAVLSGTTKDEEPLAPDHISTAAEFRNVYLALMRDDRDDHEVVRPSVQRRAATEEKIRSEHQQNQRNQLSGKSRHASLVISRDDQRTMEAWFADERYGGRGSISESRTIRASNGETAAPWGNIDSKTTPKIPGQNSTPVPLSEFRFPTPVVQPHSLGNSPEGVQRLSLTEDPILRNSVDYPERACIWETVSPLALAREQAETERRRAASPTGSASQSTPHLLTSLVADMLVRRPSSRSGQASLTSRVKETAAMLPTAIGIVQLEQIDLKPLFDKSPFGPNPVSATSTNVFEDKSEDQPIRRLAMIRARLMYYQYVLECLQSAGEILYADNISTLGLLQSLRSAGEELNQRPSGRILDHGMALDKAVQVEEAMDTWWKREAQQLNRLWRSTAGNITDLAEEHGRLVKMVPSEKILEIKVFEKGWKDDIRHCRAEIKTRKWISEAVAPAPVDEEYLTAISRDMELKGQLPGGAFRRFHHLAVGRRAGGTMKEDKVDMLLRGKIEGDLGGMMRSWGSIKGRAKAMVRNLGGKGNWEKKKGGEVFGMIDTRLPQPQPDILGSFLQMEDGPTHQAVYGTHMSKTSSRTGSGGSGNSGGVTGPSTAFPTPDSYVSRFKYKYRAVMNRSATHLDRYPDDEDRSIYVDPAKDDKRCPWPCAGPVPAAYRGTFAPVQSPPQISRPKISDRPWPNNLEVGKGKGVPGLIPVVPVPVPGPSGPRREVWELEENQPERVKERLQREEALRQEMRWARRMGAI